MKRASYRQGIEHIALNDDPECNDVEQIQGYLTVGLLADLFGVDVAKVANDVARARVKQQIQSFDYHQKKEG